MNWADKLIGEYKDGRKVLRKALEYLNSTEYDDTKESLINEMIDDMSFVIKWLETGREPNTYRGIDKHNVYRLTSYQDMEIIPDINKEIRKEREPLYLSSRKRKALINLFQRFSDRERQCFIMYEAEKMSMQEIADKLNISKGTVQTYIKRARDKVRKIVP